MTMPLGVKLPSDTALTTGAPSHTHTAGERLVKERNREEVGRKGKGGGEARRRTGTVVEGLLCVRSHREWGTRLSFREPE